MDLRRDNGEFDEDFGPDAGSVPDHLLTWVVEGKLIATSRPGPADLAALRSCGVDHIISLTMQPLSDETLKAHDMTGVHMPLPDMSAPARQDITRFVDTLRRLIADGHKVAVHCGAGLGRTGTMVACYLVSCGMSTEEAMAEVRGCRPGSVESAAQERAIRDYESSLRE